MVRPPVCRFANEAHQLCAHAISAGCARRATVYVGAAPDRPAPAHSCGYSRAFLLPLARARAGTWGRVIAGGTNAFVATQGDAGNLQSGQSAAESRPRDGDLSRVSAAWRCIFP